MRTKAKKIQNQDPIIDYERALRELCRAIMAGSEESKRNKFNPFAVIVRSPEAGLKNCVGYLNSVLDGRDPKDPQPDPENKPISDYHETFDMISVLSNNYQRKIDYYIAELTRPKDPEELQGSAANQETGPAAAPNVPAPQGDLGQE